MKENSNEEDKLIIETYINDNTKEKGRETEIHENLLKKESIDIDDIGVEEPKTSKKRCKCLKYFTLNSVILALIGISNGFFSLPNLAVNYLYKDYYKLEPAASSSLTNLNSIASNLQFIYGFISDTFPICGYKRKPYLVICTLVSISCLSIMYFFKLKLGIFVMFNFLYQITCSFINILAEALIIESSSEKIKKINKINKMKSKEKSKMKVVNNIFVYFFMKSFGFLIISFISGALISALGERPLFLITELFPLFILISSFFLLEEKQKKEETKKRRNSLGQKQSKLYEKLNFEIIEIEENNKNNKTENKKSGGRCKNFVTNVKKIFNEIKKPKVLVTLIFVLVYSICPGYSTTLFYFYTNFLKFTPFQMGNLTTATTCAILLGMVIYRVFFKNVAFRKVMLCMIIIDILLNLNLLVIVYRLFERIHIPAYLYVLLNEIFTSMTGELMTMPLIMLVCNYCQKGIEGSLYALFMSVMNFGYFIAGQFQALLVHVFKVTADNFDNFYKCLLITTSYLVAEAIFTCFIKEKEYKKEPKKKRKYSFDKNDDFIQNNLVINEVE